MDKNMSRSKEEERVSIISEHQRKGKQLISEETKTREGVITNVRLPRGIVMSIDEWVEQEMFRSRSDFLATAARHYLSFLLEKDIRPASLKVGKVEEKSEREINNF